jgi:hypothetical protein
MPFRNRAATTNHVTRAPVIGSTAPRAHSTPDETKGGIAMKDVGSTNLAQALAITSGMFLSLFVGGLATIMFGTDYTTLFMMAAALLMVVWYLAVPWWIAQRHSQGIPFDNLSTGTRVVIIVLVLGQGLAADLAPLAVLVLTFIEFGVAIYFLVRKPAALSPSPSAQTESAEEQQWTVSRELDCPSTVAREKVVAQDPVSLPAGHVTSVTVERRPPVTDLKQRYSSYSEVPFHRHQWFFWVMYFLITPVALVILLSGDVYYENSKGQLKSFGWANRIVAGILAAMILAGILRALVP